MGSTHGPSRWSSDPSWPAHTAAHTAARDRAIAFLADRATEDLARLWSRDARPGGSHRPGLAAQLAVLDDLLAALSAGELPPRPELRLLLLGYGDHPAYDPGWTDLLLG